MEVDRWRRDLTSLVTNKGLPKGAWGIVGVAVAPSNTDKIYALIENEKGGLFAGADGGKTWSLQSGDNNIRQRAWYYSRVYVDPKNENRVYCPNVEFNFSTDGGRPSKRPVRRMAITTICGSTPKTRAV